LSNPEAYEFWISNFNEDVMEVPPLIFFDKFKDHYNKKYMQGSKKIADSKVFMEVLLKELDVDDNGVILATEFNEFL
jgi:hypothetical protein